MRTVPFTINLRSLSISADTDLSFRDTRNESPSAFSQHLSVLKETDDFTTSTGDETAGLYIV